MCLHLIKRAYFDISEQLKNAAIYQDKHFTLIYKKYANFLICDILGQICKLIHEPFKNIFSDETINISRN